ncbi:hypothetical protein FM114_13585 [Luteococcus japonicus LSP_Lj1]|uniref:Uncharacterized protein n=1 Tax=Luteococcus japonicus LSP_Lj1 TaxID=1255658 RepID=A0A1R4KE58_9ACTN|nr:hypothetical protein FM114_13585 [Luteococcus japonicus LSP_Lj1]
MTISSATIPPTCSGTQVHSEPRSPPDTVPSRHEPCCTNSPHRADLRTGNVPSGRSHEAPAPHGSSLSTIPAIAPVDADRSRSHCKRATHSRPAKNACPGRRIAEDRATVAVPPATPLGSREVLVVDRIRWVAIGGVPALVLRIQGSEQAGGLVVQPRAHQRDPERIQGGALVGTQPPVPDTRGTPDGGGLGGGGLPVLGVVRPGVDSGGRVGTVQFHRRVHITPQPGKGQLRGGDAVDRGERDAHPIPGQPSKPGGHLLAAAHVNGPGGVVRRIGVVPRHRPRHHIRRHHGPDGGVLHQAPASPIQRERDLGVPLSHGLRSITVVVREAHRPITGLDGVRGRDARLTTQGVVNVAALPVRARDRLIRLVVGPCHRRRSSVGAVTEVGRDRLAGAVAIHIEPVPTTRTRRRLGASVQGLVNPGQTAGLVITVPTIRADGLRSFGGGVGRPAIGGPLPHRPTRSITTTGPAKPLLISHRRARLRICTLPRIGQIDQLTGRVVGVPADDPTWQLFQG